jgi:hypothetical protein
VDGADREVLPEVPMTTRVAHGRNRGGKNNALNWNLSTGTSVSFGPWTVRRVDWAGEDRFIVQYDGRTEQRRYGYNEGDLRFKTVAATCRWVESIVAKCRRRI